MGDKASARLLTCPECGEPCAAIPPCAGCDDHDNTDPELPTPHWNDSQTGVCACGARLRVRAGGEQAWLEEEEEDATDA